MLIRTFANTSRGNRVRYIMLENLNIMLLRVTLKTKVLCLKLCSNLNLAFRSTDLSYIWCLFLCLQAKNTFISLKHKMVLTQLQIYTNYTTNIAQKHTNCLLSWDSLSLLFDWFAAWHDDATAQPGLESSNQPFE